jgi:hypothetical protein
MRGFSLPAARHYRCGRLESPTLFRIGISATFKTLVKGCALEMTKAKRGVMGRLCMQAEGQPA